MKNTHLRDISLIMKHSHLKIISSFISFLVFVLIFVLNFKSTVTHLDGGSLSDLFDNNSIERIYLPGIEAGGSFQDVEPGLHQITGGSIEIGLRGNRRVVDNIFPDANFPLQDSYPQSYQPYASNLGKIIYELNESKGINKLGTNRLQNTDIWTCINAARFDLGYAKSVDAGSGHVGLSRTLANALGKLE